MLREKYHHIILGQNYISLIKGITYLNREESSLIIDYCSGANTTNWLQNIGELEKKVLIDLGKTYNVDVLINIDQYLASDNTLIYFNEKSLEFCDSPFLNIKEIMRKFPFDYQAFFSDFLTEQSEEEFNQEFDFFLNDFAKLKSMDQRESYLKTSEYKIIIDVLNNFIKFLNSEPEFFRQLNHIFQVMFQTCFSPQSKNVELIYLFLSAISPRYLLDDENLLPELLFIYRRLGGDIKKTVVSDWGIVDNSLKYMTLDTIDGSIKLQEVDCFIPIDENLPYESRLNGDTYLSINFSCGLDHNYVEFYQNKRVLISHKDKIGGDFPHWEFRFKDNTLYGVFAYLDSQGSKPSFYYHQIVEDVYETLQEIIPGLLKADWVTRVKLTQGLDSWFGPSKASDLLKAKQRSEVYQPGQMKPIKGIKHLHSQYSGPMGVYAYLLDVVL